MNAANTAWKQIPVMTKMACGAREATTHGKNELTFKVGSKPMRYVRVTYLPGSDLYAVDHFRVKRNDYSQITLKKVAGIYADQLGETIYHMVNK